jgi:hypothetical protein
MGVSAKKVKLAAALVSIGLSLSACGKSSTDTVDNSEITDMNAVGTMEGTTNDMSAMDAATDTNITTDMAANASDNAATENSAVTDNAM